MKEIFKVKNKKELKKFLSKGEDIHILDDSGYNLYFHLPLELYPFLLKKTVDINVKSVFNVSYLFSLSDTDKLKFLLDNGLDKKYRLKNGKSPYKNADLKLTTFFLKENIPFKEDDFSDSPVVQKYLMDNNILSKKEIEVTGVNLLNMSNDDFHIFSKINRKMIVNIIKSDGFIQKMSLDKINSLVNHGYSLKAIKNKIKKDISIKSLNLDKIKALEILGIDFIFNKENLIEIFNYTDKNVVNYFIKNLENADELLNKDFLNKEFMGEFLVNDLNNPAVNVKRLRGKNLDFFIENTEWLSKFDFPFENKKILDYLRHYKMEFLNALVKEKIVTIEDIEKVLKNESIPEYVKNNLIENLNSDDFIFLLSRMDEFELLTPLTMKCIFEISKNKYDINWLIKKEGKYLLCKIMEKSQYIHTKNKNEYIKDLNISILENIMPIIIKKYPLKKVISCVRKFYFLEDIIYASKRFDLDLGFKKIEELNQKNIRQGLPVKNGHTNKKGLENCKKELISSLEKKRILTNIEDSEDNEMGKRKRI